MGGLGFNKDDKWKDAQNRFEKMKNFSQNIGKYNSKHIHIRKSPQPKEKSKRDKALEFAMHIKKPKIKPSPERFAIEFEETKEKNRLWENDLDDRKLRLEVEKIKLFYQL